MCAKNVHFILSKGKHVLKKNKKYNEERKTSEKQSITKEKKKKNQTKARDCTNGPAQFSEYPLDPLNVQKIT